MNDDRPEPPPAQLDESVQAQVAALLHDAPQAQEVWGVVLEVLDGLVAQAVAHGWPQDTARQLVAHKFMNG